VVGSALRSEVSWGQEGVRAWALAVARKARRREMRMGGGMK
jgi:hypothetical protein